MSRKAAKTTKLQKDRLYVMSAFSCLAILFALYVYFVSASVLHVVMQQETERKISTLHTKISQLEAEYIAAQHAVSADIASLQGYVATDDKIFIDRTDPTLVLSDSRNNRTR